MAESNPTTPEYVALRKCYELVVRGVSSDPGSLCDALFSKGCIAKHVKNYTRNDLVLAEDKARKLVDCVMDQIENDPNVFHEFVEALKNPQFSKLKEKINECYQTEKNCPKAKLTHSIRNKPLERSLREALDDDSSVPTVNAKTTLSQANTDTSFACPYCNVCSLEQYLSDEGCPQASSKTLFPYLNTPGLSAEDRMVLEDTLICNAKELRALFAHTDTFIAQNLHADITVVKNFTLNLVRGLGQEENEAKLDKATSIPEVILALQPYKSFLNYEVIENITNEFGTLDCRTEMQKYITAFNDFCKRSVFELPNNQLPKKVNKRNEKILSVKVAKEGYTSIRDVFSVRQKMAAILGVKKWALIVCSIEDGCLCVRFLVPAAVMSTILPLSPDKKGALEDAGIRIGEEQVVHNKAASWREEREIPTALSHDQLSKIGPPETAQLLTDKEADVKCDQVISNTASGLVVGDHLQNSPMYSSISDYRPTEFGLLRDSGRAQELCDLSKFEEFVVYISYTDQMSEWVRNELKPLIESWHSAFRVITHEDSMISGFSVSGERHRPILEADKIVIVVSSDYVTSEWRVYELEYAIHRKPALLNGRIVPILTNSRNSLPRIISDVVSLDCTHADFNIRLHHAIFRKVS